MNKILLLLIIYLINSCGISDVLMYEYLKTSDELDPNKGLIIARIVDSTSNADNKKPYNYLTILAEDVNQSENGKPLRLEADLQFNKLNSVFASEIPPGNYKLQYIRAFYSIGEYYISNFVSSDYELGYFLVEPGKITDLGTIIKYQKYVGDERISIELLRAPKQQLGEMLKNNGIYSKHDKDNILTWGEDELEDERYIEYNHAVHNPTTYSDGYLSKDGSLYFLANLGLIMKLEPDGSWSKDFIDTNLNLTTIAKSNNSSLVVGGEEGLLFLKTAVSKEWQDISIDPKYQLLKIIFHNDTKLSILAKTNFELDILQTDLASKDLNWKLLDSYKSSQGWQSNPEITTTSKKNKYIKSVEFIEDSNILVINTFKNVIQQYIHPNKISTVAYQYDINNFEFTKIKKPKIRNIQNAGNRKIGDSYSFFSSKPHIFLENSNSWSKIHFRSLFCDGEASNTMNCRTRSGSLYVAKDKNFEPYGNPYFIDDKIGYVFGKIMTKYNFFNAFKHKYKTSLFKTTNSGFSWTNTNISPPKNHCVEIITEIKDKFLVSCKGLSIDIYETLDFGKSWKHIIQSEVF